MEQVYTILLIDDDTFIRRVVKRAFKGSIYKVEDVGTAEEAMSYMNQNVPDLILLDLRLPGVDGRTFVEMMNDREMDIPVLIISGKGDPRTVKSLAARGVIGYMRKPFDIQDLKNRATQAIIEWRTKNGFPVYFQSKEEEKSHREVHKTEAISYIISEFQDRLGGLSDNMESMGMDVEIIRLDLENFKNKLEYLTQEISLLKEPRNG